MKPAAHVATSAVAACAIGLCMQSTGAAIACLVSGILIDLDHLLDYYLFKGFTLSYRKFSEAIYKSTLPRFILIFHSYELIVFLWVLVLFGAGVGPVGLGVVIGMTLHILLDQIFNKHQPYAYFFIYRALRGFKTEAIFVP